jgi:alpha/beta hydrolase family protein
MPNLDRIALERAAAHRRLRGWQAAPRILQRPVYFVPGWTDEAGDSAWARMRPWLEATCADAARLARFFAFTAGRGMRLASHQDFMGFGIDLARALDADPVARAGGVDLVCHSMGGLDVVAAIAVLEERPDEGVVPLRNARRVIALDTPFRGFAAADQELFRMMVRARRPRDPHVLSQLRAMREDALRIAQVWRARDRFLAGLEGFWPRGADNTGGLIEVPHESASFGEPEDFDPTLRPRYRGYRAWADTSHSGVRKGVTGDLRAIAEVIEILTDSQRGP